MKMIYTCMCVRPEDVIVPRPGSSEALLSKKTRSSGKN
jgi:hypothetical protein